MKLIVIDSQELNENIQCTLKQYQYIKDLLFRAKRNEELDTLVKNGKTRLSKKSACIDLLLKNDKFELRKLKG
jgi:hypothetical protein